MRARLLLLAGALAAFSGSLFAGFHLDDYAIFAGAGLRPLGWPQPRTHLLDWLNFQVASEFLRRLLPVREAMLAAPIFEAHPLQAETVDYVFFVCEDKLDVPASSTRS